jgi:dipeptidase
LWEVAKRKGFWSEKDGLLDFLPVYAPQRAHATYATRRVWRFYNIVAPSLKLPAYTDPYANDYPFSAKPEKILSAQDLMEITVSFVSHSLSRDNDLTISKLLVIERSLRRNSIRSHERTCSWSIWGS